MSRVKGRDTGPEKTVRSLLHNMGFRFRLHRKDLPGKPDIVLPRHNKVIYVHGCFWHGHLGCSRAARPTSNAAFWNKKIDANIRRDAKALEDIAQLGWHAHVVWQCQVKDKQALQLELKQFLEK